jgi:branched-chain amino acid transport system substrate-binding protein
MKRTLALILTLLLLATLSACGGGSTTPPATPTTPAEPALPVVKIGVYEPASGDNGAGGKQETLGIQYANTLNPTVEIGGATYKVELVAVDNESSTDKAASAANTLVAAGVSVVLGSYGSGVSIAASDIFRDANIPAIGVTCTNPQVTQGNTHYFRICFLDPFQGTVLANFAADNFGAQKAYVLAKLGDDYSVGLANYFMNAFSALGGEVKYETYPEGNSDFNSYITNANNFGAEVFCAPVSTEAAALIIEQAAAQALPIPLLAGDTWDSNVITGAAQGKTVEIYVTTFYQEGGTPEFDSGFKAWLNASPTNLANNNGNDMISAMSAMGYDAYYVALEALKAAGSIDSKAVNEALWTTVYDGVTGHIAFNEVGDADRDNAVVKKVNTEAGVWDFVATQGIN